MAVIVRTLKYLYSCVHVVYHDRTSQIAENQKCSILPQTALITWKTPQDLHSKLKQSDGATHLRKCY